MKTHIMRSLAAVFVFMVAVSGAVAQTNVPEGHKFNQQRTFEALKTCLNDYNVPGFVESALYTVAECRNRYPDLNYSPLINVVEKVAKENSDPAIRYKAYLVSMYLTHGSEIRVTTVSDAQNHEYLFKQIAEQLEQKYLAFDGGSSSVAENR